ncbi:MAG: helix-turn-helix domain-containing protein [Bacteroidetes bacterium]|nr:helix-turn-helix domain-containing protein [Bacteroidota bacterium]
MSKILPIYQIQHFKGASDDKDVYANHFVPHIKHHHIVSSAHKHDFFLTVLFTKGSGTHEIDFHTYDIKPGTVFMMTPGQMHHWVLSKDIDGYVFFHTRDFYDKGFTVASVLDYPFFSSMHNPPLISLKKKTAESLSLVFKSIVEEYQQKELLKFEKIHALITLIYIELTRHYQATTQIENETYLLKLRKLELYIDAHFKTKKYPHEYASLMNISEKHLNRISKECLNKTTSELIAERIVLEAKRMLIHSKHTVSEVAAELGYDDNSYFSRFFKKNSGKTPVEFLNQYR